MASAGLSGGALAAIIVGVLLLLCCTPLAIFGFLKLKRAVDERGRQAKWRIKKLFLDLDTDDSGILVRTYISSLAHPPFFSLHFSLSVMPQLSLSLSPPPLFLYILTPARLLVLCLRLIACSPWDRLAICCLQEVSELEEMFSWLKVNLPESADGGSHPWIVKMWEALVETANAAAEEATTKDADADADATTAPSAAETSAAAADEEAAIATELIRKPAPPLPPGASLSRTQSIHAVEGASLTLAAFLSWYHRVTSSFSSEMREKVLETLEEYVAKVCRADRLFKLWDHDHSGTLDHDEIVTLLSWFEKHMHGDDIVFATIWDADKDADEAQEEEEEEEEEEPNAASAAPAPATATAAAEEPEVAENAKATEEPDAAAPAPVAARKKRMRLKKMFNPMTGLDNAFAGFPEWMASVVASLTPLKDDPDTPTPTMNPMVQFLQSNQKATLQLTIVQFRRWLLSVAGQLEASTYDAALDQLSEAALRHVTAQQIFVIWDNDGSGELEFAELRSLFAWLKANVPPQEGLDFSTLWDELPASGKCDGATFDAWLMTVTKKMKPEGFHGLQEKIRARLVELQCDATKLQSDSEPITDSSVELSSVAIASAPTAAIPRLDA